MFLVPPIGLMSKRRAPAPSALLADLDFSAPVIQSFPETALGLATALGDPTALASHIFPCQETSGNLLDTVGSRTLALVGTQPVLQDRVAVGIDDGRGYIGRKCQEFQEEYDNSIEAGDSGYLDVGTTDAMAVLLAYRTRPNTANRTILTKRSGYGWYLRQDPSGQIAAFLFSSSGNSNISTGNYVSDAAWHYVVVKIDRVAQAFTIWDEINSSAAVDISAIGSLTNIGKLQIGKGSFQSPSFQIGYMASFDGAAAQALTKAKTDTWWKHASDPTGKLTTLSRNCLISVPVADGYVGHFAPNTLPIGYKAAFTGLSKLGLYCNSAVANIQKYAEDITQWTSVNATATADSADSPDGFRNAATLTAAAANGSVYRATEAPTASKDHCYSVYVKRNGAGDVTGKIALRDTTAGTETVKTFTATNKWQRVFVSHLMGATPAGRSTVSVDDNGKSILVWGAQTELGLTPTAYVRTTGEAASLAVSNYRALFSTSELIGEIVSVHAMNAYAEPKVLYLAGGVGAENRRQYNLGISTNNAYMSASNGILEDALPVTHGSAPEEITRDIWDASPGGDATGGYEQVVIMNGVRTNGAVSPWENSAVGGSPVTFIDIGNSSGNYQPDCVIQSIKSYDGPSEDIP